MKKILFKAKSTLLFMWFAKSLNVFWAWKYAGTTWDCAVDAGFDGLFPSALESVTEEVSLWVK